MNMKEALEELKQGNIPQPACGICLNLEILTKQNGYAFVKRHAHAWPEFSGLSSCPVPSPLLEYDAEAFYFKAKEERAVWTGEYGAARLRLVDFLLTRCQE